jgi:hypothetical protein
VFLGASLNLEGTRYARPTLKVPAKNAPALVAGLLTCTTLSAWTGRSSRASWSGSASPGFGQAVNDLTDLPAQAEAPNAYVDWGATEPFRVKTGVGECAS